MSSSPTSLPEALDLRPGLGELFADYYGQLWTDGLVDPVVLELCRLRIARLLGDDEQSMLRYQPAVEAGLSEATIAELARYPTSDAFTDHERRCLMYAEQYVIDVHGITDADADGVKATMGDAGFVVFTVALGMLEGVTRLRLTLGLGSPAASEPTVVPAPDRTVAGMR